MTTAAGETSEPVPDVVGIATSRTVCGVCGNAAIRLRGSRNGQGQVVEGLLGVLVEEPHRLGRVEDRAAAQRDHGVGAGAVEQRHPALDHVLVGLRLHLGEDVHVTSLQPAAYVVDDTAGVGQGVGHDDHHVAVEVTEVVERPGVEERRRTAPGTTADGVRRWETVLMLSSCW